MITIRGGLKDMRSSCDATAIKESGAIWGGDRQLLWARAAGCVREMRGALGLWPLKSEDGFEQPLGCQINALIDRVQQTRGQQSPVLLLCSIRTLAALTSC